MLIFKEDIRTGVSCGLNDFGELFFGNSHSGYNLPDTPDNRARVLADFNFWTKNPATILPRTAKWFRPLPQGHHQAGAKPQRSVNYENEVLQGNFLPP